MASDDSPSIDTTAYEDEDSYSYRPAPATDTWAAAALPAQPAADTDRPYGLGLLNRAAAAQRPSIDPASNWLDTLPMISTRNWLSPAYADQPDDSPFDSPGYDFSGETILGRPVETMGEHALHLSMNMGSDEVKGIAVREKARRLQRELDDTLASLWASNTTSSADAERRPSTDNTSDQNPDQYAYSGGSTMYYNPSRSGEPYEFSPEENAMRSRGVAFSNKARALLANRSSYDDTQRLAAKQADRMAEIGLRNIDTREANRFKQQTEENLTAKNEAAGSEGARPVVDRLYIEPGPFEKSYNLGLVETADASNSSLARAGFGAATALAMIPAGLEMLLREAVNTPYYALNIPRAGKELNTALGDLGYSETPRQALDNSLRVAASGLSIIAPVASIVGGMELAPSLAKGLTNARKVPIPTNAALGDDLAPPISVENTPHIMVLDPLTSTPKPLYIAGDIAREKNWTTRANGDTGQILGKFNNEKEAFEKIQSIVDNGFDVHGTNPNLFDHKYPDVPPQSKNLGGSMYRGVSQNADIPLQYFKDFGDKGDYFVQFRTSGQQGYDVQKILDDNIAGLGTSEKRLVQQAKNFNEVEFSVEARGAHEHLGSGRLFHKDLTGKVKLINELSEIKWKSKKQTSRK